jgi:hypothetical protein
MLFAFLAHSSAAYGSLQRLRQDLPFETQRTESAARHPGHRQIRQEG